MSGIPGPGKYLIVQFDEYDKPALAFQAFGQNAEMRVEHDEVENHSADGKIISSWVAKERVILSMDFTLVRDPKTEEYFKTTFDD